MYIAIVYIVQLIFKTHLLPFLDAGLGPHTDWEVCAMMNPSVAKAAEGESVKDGFWSASKAAKLS